MQEEFTKSIIVELENRKAELDILKPIQSIYFGGGTPSLMETKYLEQIFEKIYHIYKVSDDAEITLEANPDDLTEEKILELKQTPVNRLSIGIQSFYDEDLQFMNRAHNSKEAMDAVKFAQENGFENITIDLIYGTPTLTHPKW